MYMVFRLNDRLAVLPASWQIWQMIVSVVNGLGYICSVERKRYDEVLRSV